MIFDIQAPEKHIFSCVFASKADKNTREGCMGSSPNVDPYRAVRPQRKSLCNRSGARFQPELRELQALENLLCALFLPTKSAKKERKRGLGRSSNDVATTMI